MLVLLDFACPNEIVRGYQFYLNNKEIEVRLRCSNSKEMVKIQQIHLNAR